MKEVHTGDLVRPGDLIRPATLWKNIIRDRFGHVDAMDARSRSDIKLTTPALVIWTDVLAHSKGALLLLVGDCLYWTWTTYVRIINR